MFEWVYFASPESSIDQIPVYGTRYALGDRLAVQVEKQLKERGLEADVIVPVSRNLADCCHCNGRTHEDALPRSAH